MLTPAHIIQKKRDGKELSTDEILHFILGVTSGEIPDYQASAFLMAVYFQGMTISETAAMTQAMLDSGERYNLTRVEGPKVDKHSTGGVGDKVSLILAPLAAACGLKVPMMAGRGLGHSGGTVDKMESIQGFDCKLTPERFEQLLNEVGCAIIGQTERIAPADKKLYALRDVTGTVECIPLIVSSILSKKIAEGSEALVMDVKFGNGAFMKTREKAKRLAKALITIAKKMGLPCKVLITNMDQPLGYSAGNALEVKEAIEVLRGDTNHDNVDFCSADLRELTIQLCAHMLLLSKTVKNVTEGRKLAHSKLADGSAWRVFQNMVRLQGGSVEQIMDLNSLPQAPVRVTWTARKRGYITRMDTETIGKILVELGGGRKKASDCIDYGVGILFHRKLGANVKPGDPLVTIHAREEAGLDRLEAAFQEAIDISSARKPLPKLITDQI